MRIHALTTTGLLVLILALSSTPLAAQGCPTGNVVLSGAPMMPVPPGTFVPLTVTGTPGAGLQVFTSAMPGQTTLMGPGPLNGVTLCLAQPLHHHPAGHNAPSGSRTIHVRVPYGAPAGAMIHVQVVEIAPSSTGPVTDTSNVVTITVGSTPPCNAGNVVLTITPDQPVQPGDTISIDVTGTPGAFAVLVSGPHPGSTTLPFGNLTLCLGLPFETRLLGVIPAGGTLSQQHNVPPGAMLPGTITVHFQAVTLDPTGGMLTFDTSNLDSLTF